MTAADNLHPDLARRFPLPHTAQIGRAISTDTENGVAALAAFALEDHCTALPRIYTHGMCGIRSDADESNEGEKDSTTPGCASR